MYIQSTDLGPARLLFEITLTDYGFGLRQDK
jgi:hypothetical protein